MKNLNKQELQRENYRAEFLIGSEDWLVIGQYNDLIKEAEEILANPDYFIFFPIPDENC